MLLCGHFHHQLAGRLGGVPVVVTPGVHSRIDLTAPPETVRALHGAGATVVDLDGPSAPVCRVLHAHDPLAGHTAWEAGPEELAEDIARLGPG